ncbi:phospholipase A2 inhibitor gamma subunit B-like [Salvelinus fontinalis]|uniref:Phospholipase A2 inhibitor subunit gamma B-like n=1 Tax=Salvelinus namaycush TaxID=8040 RepID=A0A8U0QAD0_SALNM|nr:phospholipase A2 inhibitor subunit gamma B-like [Salvelinus namaycush]XP_038840058.1 phospholipase A2 inhibitor subunit gamma B-like [Salvelinus namaycush]XP_038840059.1 phospholipase A2 inhibitor subunit gamma B-like [Salvelinus namaycush]XP_038856422.1 phospholipase A2 inhibitor subunit gamma B-like [Salvelinus namaycush]XP_038856423.1 phospholipase A2 inhibitor subunit gamma B-like [Salvelinus namaycush]XP_055796943.1 phospholipase A2 inhibitor gamma subunit B-like [Salvelinus fontinalis
MKLILTLSLICTRFYSVEMLQCFNCTDAACTNSSLVTCPALNERCLTATRTIKGPDNTTVVLKMCSPSSICVTPLNTEVTVSGNLGIIRASSNQLCCNTNGCNNETLSAPSSLANGRQCTSYSSFQGFVHNSTVACLGVEDQCLSFSGNVLGSINYMVNLQGCTSTNVCNYIDQLLPSRYINFVQFTCNTAPLPVTVTKAHNTACSIRLSLVPLLLGLTISKLI